uniref:Uncharacterized protein n=1 Tax=Brassica campestris TaxID=3711 RepID=M4E4A1_BRACM
MGVDILLLDAQCNQNFRLSGSPLLIRFNDSTNLDEITEPVAAIPQERFRFNDHNIVAEVTAVKSILSDPPQGKDHSMATVKIDSMIDSQAASFHSHLEGLRGDLRVVVATSINPKIIGGTLSRILCFGYLYKLLSDDTGNTSTTKLLRGYAKIEPMTIAELNDFIITAQPQDGNDDHGDDMHGIIS